jgi:hypothetical protein
MIADLPEFIHCKVRKVFLTDNEKDGLEDCYIFAVTCIAGRPPLFTCHTENGAVFSRLPIEAFWTNDWAKKVPEAYLCPWSCIGSRVHVAKHSYLKDYQVMCTLGEQLMNGRYLMTLDYFDGNFSEDPEQHKTHNMIELVSGQICLLPNNKVVFEDKHFTKQEKKLGHYKRNSRYFTAD